MAAAFPDYARALNACARSDAAALRYLADEEGPSMRAVVCALTRHPSNEAVVLDTLLLAWKNAYRFDSHRYSSARLWLYRILASRLANQIAAEQAPLANPATVIELSANELMLQADTLPSEALSKPLMACLGKALDDATSPRRIKTATGEDVHLPLYDESLRWPMLRSRLVSGVRETFKALVGRPLEELLFTLWSRQLPLADRIESLGLPRRSIDAHLTTRLNVSITPSELRRSLSFPASFPEKATRRKIPNIFIWAGDWDLPLCDFFTSSRYTFINDIWQHRLDPTASDAYRQFMQRLSEGRPFRSHHKGVLLDTPERIVLYLKRYLLHMEDMAAFGFDPQQGKDALGVVVDRHGRLIKINKGLHRLAMAQVLGLKEITVRVRAVHSQWWQEQTQGVEGAQALERMARALDHCRPA